MITYQDQMELFRIISKKINFDIECYAFGGNAMMFYGYKDDTKDIDLLFEKGEDRKEFVRVLESMDFREIGLFKIYTPERLKNKYKPLMYQVGESRFDLFFAKIFDTLISPKMKEDLYAIHDFRDKHNLRVKVLRKEHIALLKAITERDKDFEDIKIILDKEKNFDWQYFTDEVIWQFKQGDKRIILWIEKAMQDLKKQDIFIEQKYFKQLYGAFENDE